MKKAVIVPIAIALVWTVAAVLVSQHPAGRTFDVVGIPDEGDLPATLLAGVAFERLSADEIVIELDQ